MKIKVHYSYTNYYQALYLVTQYSKINWIMPSLGAVAVLLTGWSVLSTWGYTVLDIVALVLGMSFLFYKQLFLRLVAFVRFRQQSSYLSKPSVLEISEKGIVGEREGEYGRSDWKSYYRALYDDKVLVLFKSPLLMTTVPRRLFTAKDWQRLIGIVEEKMSTINR